MATSTIASSVAKEARNALVAGTNRTCSDGGNREDKCRNSVPLTEGRIGLTQSICYRYR